MEHTQTICCPHCSGQHVRKNGKSENGTQRWHCCGCLKHFQLNYRYHACQPGLRAQVEAMTLSGSGVRDIGRVLRISKDTVCAVLKKNGRARQPLHAVGGSSWPWVPHGGGYSLHGRGGRTLEFRAMQKTPTLDMVRHGQDQRAYSGMAQREAEA